MPKTLPERIGIAGLYCFALFAVASISGANIGLALMTLAVTMQAPLFWHRIQSSPLVWLILVCLVYAAVSAIVAGSALPDTVDHQMDQLNKWGQLVLVIVVAWWLKDDPRRLHVTLFLFATGAIIRMIVYFPWNNANATLSGKTGSVMFGLWHISFSAYLGAIVVAAILFAPRLLRTTSRSPQRFALIILLIASSLIAIEGILLGKSRGTWIAIVATFPPLLFLYFRAKKAQPRTIPWRYMALTAIAIVALLSTTIYIQRESLSKRALSEETTWHAMLQGDFDKVPRTSIGIRVYLYRTGVQHWLEKPWFGWGTGSEDHLMKMIGYKHGVYMPPHVHNIVLETLIRFGIVGFALGSVIVWLVYLNLWHLYRDGKLPADWYYFLMGVLIFNLVWGMFDIRIMRWDYRDYFLLLFGAALALSPPFREQRMLDKLNPRT